MKQKKLQLWLPLLLSVVMIVGMAIGYKLRKDTAGADAFLSNYNNASIAEVISLIKKNYVDNINTDSIQANAVNRLLSQLDPFSVYLPANKRLELLDEKNGYFTGLGISCDVINDSVYITDVTKGGPAYTAGISKGDIILSFNDSIKVSGQQKNNGNTADIIKTLENPITVKFSRNGVSKTVKLSKAAVPSPSVDAAYMIDANTAYVKLNKFSETTYKEFMYALEMLKRNGMRQLIIDLRGNGGGVMTAAVEIANEFLKDEQLIVYTEGAKQGKKEYRCKRDGLYTDLKLEVLIDETSASASEILAGALQDWDRALIIGKRSFGKGFVENQYKLSNGAALRLTVARYFTPLGRNIQKIYKNAEAYNKQLAARYHNGETLQGDTSAPQLKAYKTPKGRTVYGGGGITPDVITAGDTMLLLPAVVRLYLKGTLTKFAFLYYIRNATAFENVRYAQQIDSVLYPQKTNVLQAFNDYALKDSVNVNSLDEQTRESIWQKFIAFEAENKFGTTGYFEMNNRNDATLLKALEMINAK